MIRNILVIFSIIFIHSCFLDHKNKPPESNIDWETKKWAQKKENKDLKRSTNRRRTSSGWNNWNREDNNRAIESQQGCFSNSSCPPNKICLKRSCIKPPKLAIMEIIDEENFFSRRISEHIYSYIKSRISATNKFIIISDERQKSVTKKLRKESYKKCYDTRCQIPLGQSLSADMILSTKISYFQGVYVLSAELINLAKEATTLSSFTEFKDKRKMREKITILIRKLIEAE